jgi:hypothetical protein
MHPLRRRHILGTASPTIPLHTHVSRRILLSRRHRGAFALPCRSLRQRDWCDDRGVHRGVCCGPLLSTCVNLTPCCRLCKWAAAVLPRGMGSWRLLSLSFTAQIQFEAVMSAFLNSPSFLLFVLPGCCRPCSCHVRVLYWTRCDSCASWRRLPGDAPVVRSTVPCWIVLRWRCCSRLPGGSLWRLSSARVQQLLRVVHSGLLLSLELHCRDAVSMR